MARASLVWALFAGMASRAVGIASAPRQHGGKVTVELFYETMCPYCHQFINDTLLPLWSDPVIRPLMDLRMLPAGNVQVLPTARVSEGYRFWHPEVAKDEHIYRCQHGESECIGNMVHSCAIKLLKGPEEYMPLIFCMAARTAHMPEKSSFECMEELGIEPERIRDCVVAPTADQEMFAITQADARLKVPRKYVPWVMVNGEHIEVENGQADVRRAICSTLGGSAPDGCMPPAPALAPATPAVPA
eukprot:CAMPEP_0204531502 /NCGR_PEP_ID=MMETSP0661-20131031/11202_1 /ASSEMBLY_ACC=CAM_ASM_000606 /TAXON_ID=109239 /ORGANISM="Alexandrium margalefi, Strain AMGDE01CS-322" /LENGTH=244 /DNA_ID=CAMNT_0051537661 /DNA_START=68 /DNA_END=799 /DNA_ORIENTATION=+